MADILIRMEMPKGCKSCKLSSDSHCNATGQWLFSTDLLRSGFNWKTCRLPDCSLVELPEHGDLILREQAFRMMLDRGYQKEAAGVILEVPPVIPSNKEETE